MPTKRNRVTASGKTDAPQRLAFTATVAFDLETKSAPDPMEEVMGPDGKPMMRRRRPTFAIKAYTGATMNLAGYYNPVVVDLGGMKAPRGRIPILFNHDQAQVIGQTDAIAITESGVMLTGSITGEDDSANSVISHARNGFEWQASIGADIVRQEFLKAGEKSTVNGREVTGPLLIARESRLYETSFVAVGADSQTSASVAAKDPPASPKGATMFDQWVEAKGFDPAAISDTQKAFMQAIYDAEQKKPEKTEEKPRQTQSLDEIVASRRKEDDRIAKITAIAAEAINERPFLVDEIDKMARSAIESKSTVEQFELAILRLRAHLGGTARQSIDRTMGAKVIEAAVCLSGGLENVEKRFDERTLNLAQEKFPNGLGLVDLLTIAARENGYSGQTRNDVRGILQAAFAQQLGIRAEFSTLNVPGILSNIANKFLAQGFTSVEAGWREIAAMRSVRDFKTVTSYSLTGGMTYDKVGPGGELKHGTVGEVTYTNKAETYGRMFAITRTDIINDDLGALTQVPTKLGRGAALKLNLVFWTEFLADLGTFYTAGRGNVSTGGGSALAPAGLQAAQLKFRKQTDPDGLPLGIQAAILLVPPELEITANQLMTSLIVNTGGASTETQVPNANVWANKYRTVVSTYLSNSAITGYSTAAWWLIADPMDLPLIEVAFLNGRDTPIVESADAEFNVLGIQMRGYHDFGVSKQEYRAAVRSAGS